MFAEREKTSTYDQLGVRQVPQANTSTRLKMTKQSVYGEQQRRREDNQGMIESAYELLSRPFLPLS